MARPATLEASDIRRRGRQRLIGAVTLVALLVVFVPMLLDSEPRPTRQQPSLVIPPKDNVAPLTPAPVAAKPQPAAAPAEPKPSATVTLAPSSTIPAPSAAPAPAPAPASASAPPPTPATAAAPSVAPRLAGFAVQVGAFRDEAKLAQAREKLAAAGVVHYTERLETKSGPLTRLRAGPFTSREAAETALVSIKRGALDGKVVPLP